MMTRTYFKICRVGTAHHQTVGAAVSVGDAHPTYICRSIFEIGSRLAAAIGLTVFALTATAAELPQENTVPGGIAIVPLTVDTAPAPVAYFDDQRVMVIRHAGYWQAIIGLPLTLAPGPHAVVTKETPEKNKDYFFLVRTKEYASQHLTLKDKRLVEPGEEDLKRIAKEQEIQQRAFTTWTDLELPPLQFKLPGYGRLSSVFGLKRFFNNEPRQPHSGIDIAAPTGTPVTAPAEGTVVETGEYFFNGKTVFIDHGQGLISMLNHLSRISVERGTHVQPGNKIGEIGMSGRATGPHLHWTVSLNNTRVDPMLLLGQEAAKLQRTTTASRQAPR